MSLIPLILYFPLQWLFILIHEITHLSVLLFQRVPIESFTVGDEPYLVSKDVRGVTVNISFRGFKGGVVLKDEVEITGRIMPAIIVAPLFHIYTIIVCSFLTIIYESNPTVVVLFTEIIMINSICLLSTCSEGGDLTRFVIYLMEKIERRVNF